jgi:hypothetical protein
LRRWNMPRSRMDWPRSWSHPGRRWWSRPSIRTAGPDIHWTGGYGYRTSPIQLHSYKQEIKITTTAE